MGTAGKVRLDEHAGEDLAAHRLCVARHLSSSAVAPPKGQVFTPPAALGATCVPHSQQDFGGFGNEPYNRV